MSDRVLAALARYLWGGFQVFTLGMWGQITSQGLDYLLGNPTAGKGIFHVTDPTPPLVWGVACLLASVVLAVGMARRCPRFVMAGAFLAACINIAFGMVVIDDVFRPPLDDWRFFTDYLVKASLWAAVAFVMYIVDGIKKSIKDDEEV